ncbi:hypothetical protein ACOMHN_027305 [Nucella lapillus]
MTGIATIWSTVTVISIFWTGLGPSPACGLQCYSCDRAVSQNVQSANLHCMVNGTETRCLSDQDRCHNYVEGDSTVEKGCTRAENCIGNGICCQTDFCNGGYGADLKTGFGQPCEGETSCVQEEGMLCRRETTAGDQLSRCLCADGWFPLRAACLQQSGVGEVCYEDGHCRLDNSCQFQQCRCAHDFFPNLTVHACQLKLSILSECSSNDQCRAHNSVYLQRCVCEMGYLYD